MNWIEVRLGGKTVRVAIVRSGEGAWVGWRGESRFVGPDQGSSAAPKADEREIRAPMTGKVASVAARPGEQVSANQVLVVLEAMKIEYRLGAPRAGVVESVRCAEGGRVDLGQVLVTLAP